MSECPSNNAPPPTRYLFNTFAWKPGHAYINYWWIPTHPCQNVRQMMRPPHSWSLTCALKAELAHSYTISVYPPVDARMSVECRGPDSLTITYTYEQLLCIRDPPVDARLSVQCRGPRGRSAQGLARRRSLVIQSILVDPTPSNRTCMDECMFGLIRVN
jgi:hypothetical protein